MKMHTFSVLALLAAAAHAWMPWDRELPAFNTTARAGSNAKRSNLPGKIRGTNLGGWLISEPWMMTPEWNKMGCGASRSEFGCVRQLGQDAADAAFQAHYGRWINESDIQAIHDVGLNTIRIPVGYWIYRDLVYDTEHFPQGQLPFLDAVIKKAASLGMFVVMDLHGAPFAQKVADPFTGQRIPSGSVAAFFKQSQYDRATKFLTWMTKRIHNTPSYKSAVGMLEVLNEPQTAHDDGGMTTEETNTLTQKYYPQALKAVRDAEAALGVAKADRLHVQFMDKQWGAGNPGSDLPTDDDGVYFDDHNYVGNVIPQGAAATQADYMWYSCYTDDRLRDGSTNKLVGEFSLGVLSTIKNTPEFELEPAKNKAFYRKWWIAQQRLYEKTDGWIFWSWKTQLDNYRWTYRDAARMGIIPNTTAGLEAAAAKDICAEYFGK